MVVQNGSSGYLEGLGSHTGFRRLQELIRRRYPNPVWWLIHQPRPRQLDYSTAVKTCRFVRNSRADRLACQKSFLKGLQHTRSKHEPTSFVCPLQRQAVCFPVVRGKQVAGYVVACHGKGTLSRPVIQTSGMAVQSFAQEQEKDEQLRNLHESVQPRCVALSTIHTVHRLISSTLNFDELLPRLCRLSSQVLRASRCSIALVDRERKMLVPKAVVDRKVAQPVEHAVKLGKGVPGRVAASMRAHLRKTMLSVPLMDEDCMGVITVSGKERGQPFTQLDQEILTTLAEQAVVAIKNALLYAEQEKVALGTVKSLTTILDMLDTNASHKKPQTDLMAQVALAIADELGVAPETRRALNYAVLLHDAGRVAIPDEILLKPEKLTGQELKIVRKQPVKGVEFIRPLEILEPAMPIILHHHERFDGRGYPKGLKGEQIPLGARIMGVANAFEAMICERPYRKALHTEDAAREIERNAGTQFDPKVVTAFQKLVKHGHFRRLPRKGRRRNGR